MARDPYQRDEAAEIWLADIESLPIGPGSIAALQEYMVLFGEGDTTKAEQLLATQEEKWASPAYRARQSALASTAGGGASISRLQRALAANPGILNSWGPGAGLLPQRSASAGHRPV